MDEQIKINRPTFYIWQRESKNTYTIFVQIFHRKIMILAMMIAIRCSSIGSEFIDVQWPQNFGDSYSKHGKCA